MLKSFLSESSRGITPHTWWDHGFAGHNKEATLEVKQLFGGDSPFDTPKPVKLMRRLLELFCNGSDIVLDFFAGSGAFAHGVWDSNVRSDTALRWLLTQLPEPTNRHDYQTIADITKERLRRVSKKTRESVPLFAGDLGFRVFKLDSSNIQAWAPDRDSLDQSLLDSVDHIKPDRSEADVLYELLLKLGLDLCVPIEQRKIAAKTVHSVGAGTLMVCLAESISRDDVEPLAMGIVDWHQELAPASESTVVFRDSGFVNDVAKTNLTAILHQHGLETVRSL